MSVALSDDVNWSDTRLRRGSLWSSQDQKTRYGRVGGMAIPLTSPGKIERPISNKGTRSCLAYFI